MSNVGGDRLENSCDMQMPRYSSYHNTVGTENSTTIFGWEATSGLTEVPVAAWLRALVSLQCLTIRKSHTAVSGMGSSPMLVACEIIWYKLK